MKCLKHLPFTGLGQILLCFLLVGAQNGDKLEQKDWEPVHRLLYSTDPANKLDYNQTLVRIVQLSEIYKPFRDEETNGRKHRIENLLKSSNIEPKNCVPEYLDNLKSLIEYNSPFRVNVVPFLIINSRKIQSFCEDNINQIIRNRIELLGPNTRADMERLMGKILGPAGEPHLDLRDLLRKRLNEVSEYVMAKAGSDTSGSKTKNKFVATFKPHVIKMCKDWTLAMKPAEILSARSLKSDLGRDQLIWVRYKIVCDIIRNQK